MPERSSDDSKHQTIVDERADSTPTELGDAVEEYLKRAERLGQAPDMDAFVAEFPHCGEELRSALEGLAMLNGLLGSGGESRTTKSGAGLRLPVPSFEPGNSLAGYRIVRELGRGGMGVVYEAVHVDLDRPVALKVLRDWSGGSARRRFLNEAKTAASLHHTNIVPVFDVGQTENTTYYAMQKIEGEGLDRIIRQRRSGSPRSQTVEDSRSRSIDSPVSTALIRSAAPNDSRISTNAPPDVSEPVTSRLSESRAEKVTGSASSQVGSSSFARWVAGVGYQAAMALDYAHKRQVVHRDVKPSNLILDRTGTIWVTDFGLALRLDDPGISRGDGVLGTPRYTSPEQAARKVVDYRTDIYSLGVTLYELLTGKPAYDGESSDEVIRKILTEAPVSPRVLDPSISRDLETIILKAMSSRPEDRYATAGEFADDLDRFLRYEPVRARRIGPIGRFSRLVRRHPAVSIVTAVAASIVFGVATFAYRQVARERDDALLARTETLIALGGEKTALEKAKAAMRKQLWREASLTRMSAVPNRRRTILELVAEAATYEPEPELRSKLRNEVVEALSMSDVKATPPLTYESMAGFEMMGDQRRTVTISEDNRTVNVWDIETRTKRAEILLDELFKESGSGRQRPLPETAAGSSPGGQPGGRGSRDGPIGSVRRFLRAIFTVGDTVGVVRPDGRGVLWIDAETAEPRGEWSCPNDGILVDVQAIGNEPRILTIEYHSKGYGKSAQSAIVPGIPNPNDELVILIHDLKSRDAEPLVLDRVKYEPERGRFLPSVLSLSTDGAWAALCRFFEDTVRIVDTRTGKELGIIAAQVPVTSVAAGPQRLLAVAGGGTIRLWRYEVKQENGSPVLSTIALPSIGTNLGVVEKIRFAPEGSLIAAAGKASGIELWDIESGQAVATLGTGGPVIHMAFAARGSKLLASTTEKRNGSLRIWTIDKPLVRSFVGSSPDPVDGLVSLGKDDQESLLVRSLSGKVRFRTAKDNIFREIPLMSEMSRVSSIRTDDSARLWVMSDRSVLRYDNWSAKAPTLLSPSVTFPLGEFSRGGWPNRGINGGLILSPGSDRVFTLSGPFVQMMDPSVSKSFHPVDLPMNWNTTASQDGDRNRRERREGPEPRDFDGRQGQGRMRPLPSRPSEPMSAFSFFRGPTPVTRKLSVMPGGSEFAILRGSFWEYCEIDKLETTPEGKVWSVTRRSPPVGAPVSDIVVVAISPDRRTLALGQRSGVVTLIDLITWRTTREIRPEETEEEAQNEVVDLKFMPEDPTFLAIVRQKKISVWCLRQDPAHFLDLPVDLNTLSPVIWNGSGSGLYVVENDGNVYFWDVRRILETIEGLKLR